MNLLEAFVLTNGASTSEYAIRSLEEQSEPCKITVVRNKGILEAMQYCLTHSKSHFFLKVDDDMFLHPRVVEFYSIFLESHPDACMYACNLWEYWTKRVIECLKAYNTERSTKVGFKKDGIGRIDYLFLKNLERNGFAYAVDAKSVVAVHALRSMQEQSKYFGQWPRHGGKIRRHVESNASQYQKVAKLNSLNKSRKSKFWSQCLSKV